MAYRPNFKSIVEGNIVGSSNPLRYVRKGGEWYWQDDDMLILDDVDFDFRKSSGNFQMIVKPDWDMRIRLRTENWGGFGQSILDAMGENRVNAYNVTVDNPIAPTSRWKSSMEFTLRGDGMLGIWVDGASPHEVWGTGAFDDEVRVRMPDTPKPTVLNNGFLISFTHPYGDYSDTSTYTLRINEMNDDIMVEVLAVEERKDVPTAPPSSTTQQPEPISASDVLREGTYYPHSSGEDPETGFTWNVQILDYGGKWWVVSNGEIINFYDTRESAEQSADAYVDNARRRAKGATTDPTPNIDVTTLGLGIGAGVIVLLLAVVFVASR